MSLSQVLAIDRAYMAMIVGKGGESVTRIRTATEAQIMIQKPGMISPLTGPDEETVVVRMDGRKCGPCGW